MFESIKKKIWDLLKGKEVSLAMLYNREGEILWYKGREIKGKTIDEGQGFSKSLLKKVISNFDTVEEKNVIIAPKNNDLPNSAHVLDIKSLIIQPISEKYFLYIDSGIKESFNRTDIEVFKAIGGLLGEMIEHIEKSEKDVGGITGNSNEIKRIRELTLKYSLEEEPVLLLGETGVGKSHIAELIHRYSGRKGNFITISTPSIPDNLFESEIFGHKKGAFTDAKSDKRGYIDEAERGTLFLDEISEVPISFQAKLLRFIETRRYLVLGDSVEREADVRIVAATNRDLSRLIDTKQFREDLYYRLQVLEIEIPPLRKRKDDIETFVMKNIGLLKGKKLENGFWDALITHDWPGNVRELITVLIRAGILLDSPISYEDIQEIINQSIYKKCFNQQINKTDKIRNEIKSGQSFWEVVWRPFINKDLNRSEVKDILVQFYIENDKNLKSMTKEINIKNEDYPKFISSLHKYNVHPGH